ncbi:MAG: hypothetical protein KTR30_06895 [Saprospiraceae bacterium]|nr:hypothetical protein [Saprospiraceae bacterium]
MLCLSLIYLPLSLFSQEEKAETEISLLDRMQQEDKISLQITTNIDSLYADWRLQSYHWGEAKLSFANGEEITEEVKVKIRGKYRSRYCENPPIKIKYSNKSLKKRNFKKLNEYKLVYPCKSNEEYQAYVLKEYLIYKMYNELTDNSLRVQLVDFNLKDSLSSRIDRQFTGFLIEDREELIHRVNAVMSDMKCMRPNHLNQHHYTIFQVFQFLIGNTDWILPTCKNSEIISLHNGEMIPIPYDFDFSGMVDASYATTNIAFGFNSVKQRYFLGHLKPMEDLIPVLELYKEKRQTLTKIIEEFELLNLKDRKRMIRYLDSFYKILDKPKKVKRLFVHPMAEAMAKDY